MIDPIQLILLAAALSRPDDALREIEHQILAQPAISISPHAPATFRRTSDGQIGPAGNASEDRSESRFVRAVTARFAGQTAIAPTLD